MRLFAAGSGALLTDRKKRRYLNFYANLIKSSDAYLTQVLDALQGNGLMRDTIVIRTADHGEMGLAHGGLRQKNFNMYEEATKVPLIFSNPRIWEKSLRCNHLVSHVDFLPTLASLFGAPSSARDRLAGRRLHEVRSSTPRARSRRRTTCCSTSTTTSRARPDGPYPSPPNHVVGMRERHWKIVKYFDIEGVEAANEWEFYDLRKDPLEQTTSPTPRRTRPQSEEPVQADEAEARAGRRRAPAAAARTRRSR